MDEYVQTEAKPGRDRYLVSVEQYKHYFRNGFLIVPGLLPQEDVRRLQAWSDDLLTGKERITAIEPASENMPVVEVAKKFNRVHMLHRLSPSAEWGLLHPRVIDVLEALIGPDVLALQTMLFYNAPGTGGQGWHQDSFYINTYPDTLIGAWTALDVVDEANGCLWVAPGSHIEPIYPTEDSPPSIHALNSFGDLQTVQGVSQMDDETNTLAQVAKTYSVMPVPMKPGDVLFFHSHLLHRSHPNRTTDRWRRAFVSHYCNGRAWVPWNHGMPYEGESGNHLHILARGSTHLPYASPQFGNEVRLGETASGHRVQMMMPGADGMLTPTMMSGNRADED